MKTYASNIPATLKIFPKSFLGWSWRILYQCNDGTDLNFKVLFTAIQSPVNWFPDAITLSVFSEIKSLITILCTVKCKESIKMIFQPVCQELKRT